MLLIWSGFPFVRLIFFFIIGIIYGIFIGLNYVIAIGLFCLCFSTYIILYIPYGKKYSLKPLFGLLAGGELFFFGIVLIYNHTGSNFDSHIINIKSKPIYYKACVTSEVEEKEKSYKTIVEVKETNNGSKWERTEGEVLLYIKKDSSLDLKYGDLLLIKGFPIQVDPPYNPEEFDYKKYLSYRGIYAQQFISGNDIKLMSRSTPNILVALSNVFRHQCDSIIKKNVKSQEEYKIASALILGVRNSLDNKIRDAYSATGTMHILAVSGMHVSLIYFILIFVLGRIEKNKYGKVMIPILIILMLWFYALVTGFSASVLRAVTMFSFIVFAKAINRNSNVYNTLALSAFVLLCFDPYLIMDVGFQLSYLAVFGIVYIYPKIYHIWEIDHQWLDQLWMITCVSLVAQLATFPLSLFYFHQFPVWFLFSNLIVIPISTLVLYLGLLLLSISWIPLFASIIGLCTEKSIWLMNKSIFIMQELPLSVIDKIDISVIETFMIYGILAILFLFIETRKFIWYKICFGVLIVLVAIQLVEIFIEHKQKGFSVYSIHGHSAMAFVNGTQAELLVDTLLFKEEAKLKFHMYAHLWKYGIKKYDRVLINDRAFLQLDLGKLFIHKGLRFLWIDKPLIKYRIKNKLKVDYLIVSNNSVKNMQDLNECVEAGKIIFDSSNKKYITNKLFAYNIHCTNKDGAYIQYLR